MSDYGTLQDRVLDNTLRGGQGNRDQIKEHILEAIKNVDAITRPVTKTSVETLIANQQDYSIASDFAITDLTSIRDILYTSTQAGIVRPLEEVSAAEIREMRLTPTASNYVNLYGLEGIDTLLLFPTTQNVGDTIKIIYTSRQPDLVNDTDVPTGLPPEWHDLYELAAIQSAMRLSSPEYAAQYMSMFDKRLGDYRRWRNHRSGTIARRVTVGRYGRRIMPHDNSTDLRY